jgi:DNA-binding transcriptional LysR family regulator
MQEPEGTLDNVDPSAGRPLNLRQIEVFRAIMLSGSTSAAALALHISQPAISRVLAISEQRLGYPLFERLRSRLVPTPEARQLYAEVERVYGGIQQLNELAASLGRSGSGVLRVMASASFGQQLVPRALRLFRQTDGGTRVDYRTVTFDQSGGYFLSGQADIGISMQPPDHPSLTSVVIGRQPIYCIMPADHPLARHAVIQAQEFLATSWIGYPADTPLSKRSKPFFGGKLIGAPDVEVHSPMTAYSFVRQGLGPALVDGTCLDWAMPDPSIAVRPIEPACDIDIWATHSNQAPLSLPGRRFLAALEATLAEEQGVRTA